MIGRVLVALATWLFAVPASAYGIVPSQQAKMWAHTYSQQNGYEFSSAGAACTQLLNALAPPNDGSCGAVERTLNSCNGEAGSGQLTLRTWSKPSGTCALSGPAVMNFSLFWTLVPDACPEYSTKNAEGQCICDSGFKKQGSVCVVVNCQQARDDISGGMLSWSGNGGLTCYAGCVMQCSVRGYQVSTNTSSCGGWAIFATSESCQGRDNGANSDGNNAGTGTSPQACGTGQCPGTVNGVAVCVACSVSTQGPSVTASAPSGSTPPPLANAPPGSTGSTSNTTCNGTTCTTTTNYVNSSGGSTGSTEETQDQKGFCSENPTSPVCKTGSFGGSCATGFTCEGDGVQCAMAREQHVRNCAGFSGVGTVADATMPTSTVAISVTPETGWGADDATCPNMGTFNFMGQDIPIENTLFCDFFAMVRPLVIAFAYLAAAGIVIGGIRN